MLRVLRLSKPCNTHFLNSFLLLEMLFIARAERKKLTFRIFADDTNMFYSSKDPEQLQSVINEELGKVLKFCAANMLSINFKKTNYMIITTPKKKTNIRITACNIEQNSQIKYLGVFIDEHLKWDAQLQHINNKITKNIGILFKLRHYVPISTLKQLYYSQRSYLARIKGRVDKGVMPFSRSC